ncbi:MAG: hypothetical protein COY38_00925 [Candidatus Aenigmarchaeota archaeon CG_4_10_14_0_8_um_filter_37_24]|nr:hypothetical protein [Candidatus Aenigmarchaeota archaeon]OIN87238.1 MAG: hypothetical protein AUJ50_02975 [Candidatus Aenigmarchaeota archaeon CG1_02_38_14]PIV69603.1 MAG: hypothetical protein COS07_00215 [Candidatus Aenigmarchaeota archaeon CG01_land_8_20_14_3_00_37_9]PIW40808.1 MAG: hypothetical protein COW21_05175 [Candidatus Aenigmarchaeota archaeon CG15_BIG_FIL_POST_REV_8_21_14_020_37_27]PIX50997.1 MAG: hypothetical protein COZ52_01170 [Candidatus Aenigmarchaeota archaeon CG_4_8_14_3_u
MNGNDFSNILETIYREFERKLSAGEQEITAIFSQSILGLSRTMIESYLEGRGYRFESCTLAGLTGGGTCSFHGAAYLS